MTWEYRCVKFPMPDDFSNALPYKQQYLDLPGQHTDLLNELGKDRWEWFHANGDLFYFRREISEPEIDYIEQFFPDKQRVVPPRPEPNIITMDDHD